MSFTTSHDLVRIKIKRNENLVKLLSIESKISKLEMIMLYRRVSHNTKYVKLLEEINDIERLQLYDYSLEREHQIKILTNEVNEMTTNTADLKKEILPLKTQFMETITIIQKLNNSIPDAVFVLKDNKPPIPEHKKNCSPFNFA